MAINAANLIVTIGADASMAQQGIMGIVQMLGKGGVLAIASGAAALAVGGIAIAATKMAADFQSGMTSLVTGAGESASNLKLVSDGILKLADATGTSTDQLTSGMYMIESAGYHGAAGLNILQAAAEGAKVGNADLGTVADAVTTVMKDYPNVVGGASGAVNTLIATVANGKTHMADLAASLSGILPTASAAGVGLNDVMGALATMTGEGVDAANATTYLRQLLLNLTAPSTQAKKALADVGLTTDQVSAAMKKSLPDALKLITDAVGTKFPVGSAAYINAIKDISGGTREIQGMLDLTGQHMTDFTANVAGVAGAVTKGGNSITGWSMVQGTFNQKMSTLNEIVQTTLIRLGQKLLPVATQLVGLLAADLPGAIDTVTGACHAAASAGQSVVRFLQDTGPAATLVKGLFIVLGGAMLGFAASAIPAAVAGILASVTAFGAQAVAAGAAAVATLAAAAPFILIGAAIGAVIAIVILAVTHWQQITQALQMAGKMAGMVGGQIKAFARDALTDLKNLAMLGLNLFLDLEVKLPLAVLGMAAAALGHVKDFVAGFLGHVLDLDRRVTRGAEDLASHFLSALAALPGRMLSLGEQLIANLARGITGAAGQVTSAISSIPLVGGATADLTKLIPHFATGGTMPSDGLALVGEREPEIVRLPGGAQVTPLSKLAQGGPVSGLPAGMAGGASGQMIQVQTIVQMDGKQVARVVTRHLPEVVASAAGIRRI